MPLDGGGKRSREEFSFLSLANFQIGTTTTKRKKVKPAKPAIKSFFALLPFSFSSSYVELLLPFAPTNPSNQQTYIDSFKKEPMFNRHYWTSESHIALRAAIYKINGYRFQLKRLLHHWRSSKIIPRCQEDIVTGETPAHPIYIVDWNGKQSWVYEANTLMTDITNRLMHHDVFFEDVQRPRNPLTNLPLTYAQKISVWNQLSYAPVLQSTAFTAYRSAKYNIFIFINEYKTHILLHALRKSMRLKGEFEVNDRILDFIRYCHDAEDVDYLSNMFAYLLLHLPDISVMTSWRKLCTKYHELDILYAQLPDKLLAEREKILTSAVPLIDKRPKLVAIWMAHRNLTQ